MASESKGDQEQDGPDDVSTGDLLKAIRSLRSQSLIKDVLLALVPLAVAMLSISYSSRNNRAQLDFAHENSRAQLDFAHENSRAQLDFARDQQIQTAQIEGAKLLGTFAERILGRGEGAELARVALESVALSKSQREWLETYIEQNVGGSDGPETQASVPPGRVDPVFAKMLDDLFASDREKRAAAYTRTRQYLGNGDDALIDQMIAKADSDLFNLKGRSNVLSLWSSAPSAKVSAKRNEILGFLAKIENLGKQNPAYGVGPQTTGWITEIRTRLSVDPAAPARP